MIVTVGLSGSTLRRSQA